MQTLRKLDASFAPFLDDGAKIMFLIFSALAVIICIGYQWAAVRSPYSMDYGEAPLVDQAMRLASGQNIYRADLSTPPYTISNYPPLYIVLLAISVKLLGPASSFVVGRIISALCAWIAGLCLGLIIYTSTRDRFAALSAGFIFLAFPFVMFWSPLLRIDMLALALSLAGLCLLTWRPDSPQRFVSAALLLVAAIFTRQSYALAAPLAGFVWLLTRDWKQTFRLAGLVGGLSLLLFLILNVWTRGGFYFNIVTANVNEFKMDNLMYHWNQFRDTALILLLTGGASFFLSRRLNPLWALSTPYLIGATVSAATIGKIGSNVNYLLELCAALSLAAGAVIAWSGVQATIHSLRPVVLCLLALAVGRLMHVSLQDFTGDLRDRQVAYAELSKLESLVKETSGPILADEYMGMLTLQGRSLTIQPFEVTQLAWAGKWDQTPLLNSIRQKEYAAIIIYDRPWANERWTQEMIDAINGSYILSDIVAENKIYVPYELKPAESLEACPGALWRLPSDSRLGVKRQDDGLMFFGQGNDGQIPIYAVADGLLWRPEGRLDGVIIQHDDPLEAGKKIWAIYGGMSAGNGTDSFVAEEFPIGVEKVPVKAGQFLGYQGSWSGNPQWPMWIHLQFALIRTNAEFPWTSTSVFLLDPSPYLGLALKSEKETSNLQPLICSSRQ
jgi:Dolichyl-phosphate-mannose-protein mannosyltransferase